MSGSTSEAREYEHMGHKINIRTTCQDDGQWTVSQANITDLRSGSSAISRTVVVTGGWDTSDAALEAGRAAIAQSIDEAG